MKLLRFGTAGQEKPGVLDSQGRVRDLSGVVADIDGAALSDESLARLRALDLDALPLAPEDVRYGPCVGKVGKFLCIGLNYADHAAESGLPIPDEPVLFTKAISAITGPNDTVLKPRGSTKLDWEVELGVVIGKTASYVEEQDAEAHIAGYCVINDVSERAFQIERGGTWDKGKGCDSFGPIGPWLVTRDEVADPANLKMWLTVNGKTFQDGSTATMIFKPAFIVAYVSQFMTLHPGDVISTGTPPGVGLGQRPEVYLDVGDVMALGIDGLGQQRQVVGQA
jgi:2-keto-4-pentenoate hydratase/2-oxohepta-3-ene-1,7-dioic acid hydratase in catechol pathway